MKLLILLFAIVAGLGIINADTTLGKLFFMALVIAALCIYFYVSLNIGSVVVE